MWAKVKKNTEAEVGREGLEGMKSAKTPELITQKM